MEKKVLDAIIVGAGHAGLSASYYLAKMGLKHIVIERGTTGHSWQTQRWDSFVLNTANKINVLPGDDSYIDQPDGFSTARQFAGSLRAYAVKFKLPVVEQTLVVSIDKPAGNQNFTVKTKQAGVEKEYHSSQVIICSGAQNTVKIPAITNKINAAGIKQLHVSEYKSAGQLPDGAVLVVGSAQSGCQVAADIAAAGRKVFLSTSMVPRMPRQYRGKDIMDWLIETNFFGMKTSDVADQKMLHLPVPQLAGMGKTISLQSLAQSGVSILGKLSDADAAKLFFQPDAAQHVHFADEVSAKLKAMLDEYIEKNNITAAPAGIDPEDIPDTAGSCISNETVIDIKQKGITAIIWATGFTGNYDYIRLPVLDNDGRPVHNNGETAVDGLYFLGLPWLRTRGSGLIRGTKEDAAYITEKVCSLARHAVQGITY